MDVVYVVGPAEPNEELRYSLRSVAANLVHDRIWIAGHCPSWVADSVRRIPVKQSGRKQRNGLDNMRAACTHPDVSETFIYLNDDFFILQPTAEVPVQHRGPLSAFLKPKRRHAPRRRATTYAGGRAATAELLERLGYTDPLAYEPIHTPMPIDKAGMLAALDAAAGLQNVHYRTLYGNLSAIGGALGRNVKISETRSVPDPDAAFTSTSDRAWAKGAIGPWIRARFPTPGPYER